MGVQGAAVVFWGAEAVAGGWDGLVVVGLRFEGVVVVVVVGEVECKSRMLCLLGCGWKSELTDWVVVAPCDFCCAALG